MESMDTDSEQEGDVFDSVRLPENVGKDKFQPSKMHNTTATLRKLANQGALIETVSSGVRVYEALDRLKIKKTTYYAWRNKQREFAMAMDEAKMIGFAVERGADVPTTEE